jgi:hypothetical protein
MLMDLLAITLPYGVGGLFDGLFDRIIELRDDIYGTLSLFTYTLAFAGLLVAAYKQAMGGDLSQLGSQLFSTAIVAVIMPFLPNWVIDAEAVLGFAMIEDMGIDMEGISNEYIGEVAIYIGAEAALVVAALAAAVVGGIFAGAGTAIVACLYALIAIIMIVITAFMAFWVWFCLIIAYILQAMGIEMGVACSPLFLGMFLFPTTKETAVRYFTGLIAICFWPLGWGIGWSLVDLVFDAWQEILLMCLPLVALDVLFAGVVTGTTFIIVGMMYWTMIKKAPPLVAKALTTGTQIGAGLVSAGVASAASTVSSAVSAAGSVASTAMSIGGTAAGAAIGSAAPGAGTAAGAQMGSAIGGAAGQAVGGAASAAGGAIKGAGDGFAGMSEGA